MATESESYIVALRYAAKAGLPNSGPDDEGDHDWHISVNDATTIFLKRCASLRKAIECADRCNTVMGASPAASAAIVFGRREQLAAALARAGHPGQLLICSQTADHIGQFSEPISLGMHVLEQDLPAVEVFQWEIRRLRSSFPPLRCLYRVRHNLQERSSPFFGRERELDELRDRLRLSKIVTLVGAEGIGKSSLAWRFGFEYAEEFPGGVWRLEVEQYETYPSLLARLSEIVAAFSPQSDLATECLIILDDCDMSLAASRLALEKLIEDVPNCRILATATHPLEVSEEAQLPTLGLSYPNRKDMGVEELLAFDAARVFWDRVLTIHPELELTRSAIDDVIEICKRVEGSPAALIATASPYANVGIESLRSSWAYAPEVSQSSIVEACETAFQSLSEQTRRALMRLSAFAGDWPATAAYAVVGLEETEWEDVLRELVECGIVEIRFSTDGVFRYKVSSATLSYIASLPSYSNLRSEAYELHLKYFADLAEEDSVLIEGEMQNCRLALSRAFDRQDPTFCFRLILALGPVWHRKGPHGEAADLCERACLLARERGRPELARLLNLVGTFRMFTGELDAAESAHEEALTLSQPTGDKLTAAMALANLATIRKHLAEWSSAKEMAEQAICSFRELREMRRLAICLTNYGAILDDLYDTEGARAALAESILIFESLGEEGLASTARFDLAEVALRGKRVEEAKTLYLRSLERAVEVENPVLGALSLEGICISELQSGNTEIGALTLGAAAGIRGRHGAAQSPIQVERVRAATEMLQDAMGRTRLLAQLESAKSLTPREALELVKQSMNSS